MSNDPNEAMKRSSELSVSAASYVELEALPQLMFRAPLGQASSVQLFSHPTLNCVLGVILSGDSAVRFVDVTPAPDVSVPTAADCSAGYVEHPDVDGGGSGRVSGGTEITRATISRDGAILVCATALNEILVYSLLEDVIDVSASAAASIAAAEAAASSVATLGFGLSGEAERARWMRASAQLRTRVRIRGTFVRSFLCDSSVSALSVLHIPCHPDSFSFTRFRLNGYAILSGHTNGFLNLWWCGNNTSSSSSTSTSSPDESGRKQTHIKQSNSSNVSSSPPLASYPPLHASRGPILHITNSFVASTGTEHGGLVPPMFNGMRAGAQVSASAVGGNVGGGLSTFACVGAHGARGWRLFELPHIRIPDSRQQSQQQKRIGLPIKANARPDGGRFDWGNDGRRVFVPAPSVDVSHLINPLFDIPSLADCLRSSTVGENVWRSHSDIPSTVSQQRGAGGGASAFASSANDIGGVDPRGFALLQRYPGADSDFLPPRAIEGGISDDSLPNSLLFPGLAPSAIAADRSMFRLLSRSPSGRFSNHGQTAFQANDSAALAVAAQQRHMRGLSPETDNKTATGEFLHLPRTVLLLLTERGISCAGFDHAPGLAITNNQAEKKAAIARERLSALKEEEDLRQLQAVQVFQKQREQAIEIEQQRKREKEAAAARARIISIVPPNPPQHNTTSSIPSKRVLKTSILPPHIPSSSAPIRHFQTKSSETKQTDKTESRDIWAPLVDETKNKVASVRPTKDTAILARSSYPMSITGRGDSIVRGQKSVFNNIDRENESAAVSTELRLQYLPRHSAARLVAKRKSTQ